MDIKAKLELARAFNETVRIHECAGRGARRPACGRSPRGMRLHFAGNGWRPAVRLPKLEPVEGAKTNQRSPMKPQDAGNRNSSVDQGRETRNPFDVMDVPDPNDRDVLEFA